jgi:hypothetical protein
MKTGRPDYYIPSPTTVSRDVKRVFANVRKCIAKMLQEHNGKLNFATDAWTSPNHKAFVAVTAHFEVNGEPVCMLLDLVEVATSHSGVNLAAAFAQILDEFGISDKVSNRSMGKETILTYVPQALGITCDNASPNDTMIDELPDLIKNYPGASNRARCFNHIVALVAIRVVRQFDIPGGENKSMDEAEQELRDLAEGLDIEEAAAQRERESDDDEEEDDEDGGWVEARANLSTTDREELDESVRPVRMLLVKVSLHHL